MANQWERFRRLFFHDEPSGFSIDLSRIGWDEDDVRKMEPAHFEALDAMEALENGAVANPDEKRMVGHYWLRAPEMAPSPQISEAIRDALARVKEFAARIHRGEIRGGLGKPFSDFLLVGIGGSALGPQLIAEALPAPAPAMRPWFFDNTDPDGMARTLAALGDRLDRTLVLVISKSGGTAETHNGMLAAEAAWKQAGLEFPAHAVAVTGEQSRLDRQAREQGWLAGFPMWGWVGGRTSITSAVGLLPAALMGVDPDSLLEGARAMDVLTRRREMADNPAAMLALAWRHAGQGRGSRDMVVLPYKDRLGLMARYLQQLVMESLGKELDLSGNVVHQGLTVYGNKGSTDQHAYVQQLRDGLNNFFVTFIEVLADEAGSGHEPLQVEPGVTIGDYLEGFLLGTRAALSEHERESITITLRRLDARSLGGLIALYERAVGLYAAMIGINAYHQPGVEAGKKAARVVLDLQLQLLAALEADPEQLLTAEQWAGRVDRPHEAELVFKLLERLAANGRATRASGLDPWGCRYGHASP